MSNIKIHFKAICLITGLLIPTLMVSAQSHSRDIYKGNTTPINSALKNILKLEPKINEYNTGNLKSLSLKEGGQYGFAAKNMNEVFPALVSTKNYSYMYGKNTYRDAKIQTIDEVGLIPVLVASIQELHYEMERLKLELKELKNKR